MLDRTNLEANSARNPGWNSFLWSWSLPWTRCCALENNAAVLYPKAILQGSIAVFCAQPLSLLEGYHRRENSHPGWTTNEATSNHSRLSVADHCLPLPLQRWRIKMMTLEKRKTMPHSTQMHWWNPIYYIRNNSAMEQYLIQNRCHLRQLWNSKNALNRFCFNTCGV